MKRLIRAIETVKVTRQAVSQQTIKASHPNSKQITGSSIAVGNKSRQLSLIVMSVLSYLLLSACESSTQPMATNPTAIIQDNQAVNIQAKQTASEIQQHLAQGHYEAVANYIHPVKGILLPTHLRFSLEGSKHFSLLDFKKYLRLNKVKFTYNTLVVEPIPVYLASYIDAKRFNTGSVTVNRLNVHPDRTNLATVFPLNQYTWVTYQVSEAEANSNIDRYGEGGFGHLVMVFEMYQDKPHLVALVNDMGGV